MAGGTVSAGQAKGALDYAAARGLDVTALVRAAGLEVQGLDDPDRRVPLARYLALLRAAATQAGDPAFALRFGADVGMAEVSIVGLIMEASATMADALVQMQRYGRLATELDLPMPGPRYELVGDAAGLHLVDRRPHPDAAPELTEITFARLVCGPRRFLPRPHVLGVSVTHARPDHAQVYDQVFQCPVTFGAARNALRLDPGVAAWPVAQAPRYVFGVLAARADELIARLEADRTTRGRLEAILLPDLHHGALGAEAAAARLGVSRQTLFRRLRAEGVTFAQVLADLRLRLAEGYLRGRRVSVNETAYLVGFSDPAAFSRAFKRWTGLAPRAFAEGAEPGSEG